MSFDYTSGNPANLVGGQPASMADIQGPFTDLRTFLNQRIAAVPTLVSSLPASPVDGQEVYYLADAGLGVVWHLRYRSASGSTYKWEGLGAQQQLRAEGTGGQVTGTSYADIPTGASVTVPLAGDYVISFGATEMHNNTTSVTGFMTPKLGAAPQSDVDSVQMWSTTTNAPLPAWHEIRRDGIPAASVIKLQARVSATSGLTIVNPILAVRPVRVG